MRRVAGTALAVLVLLTVAGCSGVPTSSAPQVVRTIGLGDTRAPSPSPPPDGIDQRGLVVGFLAAMTVDPDRHLAARTYLGSDAARTWSDDTVTVVGDTLTVGLFDAATDSVTVTYQQTGSVSAAGVYSPVLVGSGQTAPTQATFTFDRENGQYRIADPVPPGLLLTTTDFLGNYPARSLYFFDTTGTRLVPDVRYSALTDTSVGSFLLAQLFAGPRPELANAVLPTSPAPTGQQRASLTVGSPTVVQVPGAAAASPDARRRLAGQLAYTLRQAPFGSALRLVDGGATLSVTASGDVFGAEDFPDVATLRAVADAPSPVTTFVRDGAVVDQSGSPLPGVLGSGGAGLVAAAVDRSSGTLRVAGTTGSGDARTLEIGTSQSLADAGVPAGPLTRPVWAPGRSAAGGEAEVWVGSGSTIYRVVPGKAPTAVPVSSRTGAPTGSVVGMAFAAEGSRLALVIRGADDSSQVWAAAVVRSGPDVRLDQLEPVTPVGIEMDDVAWNGESRLVALGVDPAAPARSVWSFTVDGSALAGTEATGLPDRPRTIAASPRSGTSTWVSVGSGSAVTVWLRPFSAVSWSPPGGGSAEPGSAPSFAQ